MVFLKESVAARHQGAEKMGKKVKLLMQTPPTDPLYDASHLDESTSTLRPTTEDVKRKPNDWPVP